MTFDTDFYWMIARLKNYDPNDLMLWLNILKDYDDKNWSSNRINIMKELVNNNYTLIKDYDGTNDDLLDKRMQSHISYMFAMGLGWVDEKGIFHLGKSAKQLLNDGLLSKFMLIQMLKWQLPNGSIRVKNKLKKWLDEGRCLIPFILLLKTLYELYERSSTESYLTFKEIIYYLIPCKNHNIEASDIVNSILENRNKGIYIDLSDFDEERAKNELILLLTYYTGTDLVYIPTTLIASFGGKTVYYRNEVISVKYNHMKIINNIINRDYKCFNFNKYDLDKDFQVLKLDYFKYYCNEDFVPKDLLDENDPIWREVKENLLDRGHKRILLTGPPGTSKTWYAEKIALKIVNGDTSRIENVQFHQSYSYEDFVEGYVPNPEGSGFTVKKKVFLLTCEKALLDPLNPYVLIIDEFTRGDASRIFGEILTYMEYPHRSVKPLYSGTDFYLPENLIIIGTMNPHDRSISDLDIMMERRFKKVQMPPNPTLLKEILSQQDMDPPELIEQVVIFFEKIQEIYDIGFGHAYFVGVKTEEDLKRLWKYQLRDLFQKYFQFEQDKFREAKSLYLWSD